MISQLVLEQLLASRHHVCAVLLPGSRNTTDPAQPAIRSLQPPAPESGAKTPGELSLVTPFVNHSTMHVAWAQGIPVFALDRLDASQTLAMLGALNPDVACVACFPRRIPAALLAMPKQGFVNVHPSLLPNYRGPAPLFWQLRAGERHTGVTIHWMDAEFDTGPLAGQRPVPLPDGISGPRADVLLATTGGELLVDVLDAMASGNALRRPQPYGGRYDPWPKAEDFTISSTWSARRIYNFMRGTAVWGHPYLLEMGQNQLWLSDAISWTSYGLLGDRYVREGDTVRFQCMPGVVHAQVATVSGGPPNPAAAP